MYQISDLYKSILDDQILQQEKYSMTTNLDAHKNANIHRINSLIFLKILNANGNSGIDQEYINNLTKLYAKDNKNIRSVSGIRPIKIHDLPVEYGIGQDRGSLNIDLIELCISYNPHITSILHMKSKVKYNFTLDYAKFM